MQSHKQETLGARDLLAQAAAASGRVQGAGEALLGKEVFGILDALLALPLPLLTSSGTF